MKLLTMVLILAAGTLVLAQSEEKSCCSKDKNESSVMSKMCEVPETVSKKEVKKDVTTTSTAPALTVESTKIKVEKKVYGKEDKAAVDEVKKKDCCTVEKTETVKEKEKE